MGKSAKSVSTASTSGRLTGSPGWGVFRRMVILLILAITSPAAAVRKLGGKRWNALHRLVYLAGVLAVRDVALLN